MSDRSPTSQADIPCVPEMKTILIGLAAAAVVGTMAYSIGRGVPGRLFAQFSVLAVYLPPPYLFLYFLSPTKTTDGIALADHVCATVAAMGLLGFWGWFVTVPMTPKNAQAPIGLFMIGWTGAIGFYGAFKLVAHGIRRIRDR